MCPRHGLLQQSRKASNGTWRPVSVLDEYVLTHLPNSTHQVKLTYRLCVQMGSKRSKTHQLATAHGLWTLLDRIATHQLGKLC